MATIYLDIETLPALDWDDERKQRQVRDKVPKNYKDPEKIAQWIAEESDAVWRRTALSPLYGRILCVCVAIGDHDPHVYWSDGTLEGERGVLIELTGLVSRLDVQVAHNGHGFDFPWLRKRALKHRLTGLVSMYNVQQSWKATHLVDTLEVWAGPSRDREDGRHGDPRPCRLWRSLSRRAKELRARARADGRRYPVLIFNGPSGSVSGGPFFHA